MRSYPQLHPANVGLLPSISPRPIPRTLTPQAHTFSYTPHKCVRSEGSIIRVAGFVGWNTVLVREWLPDVLMERSPFTVEG
jgi:hypothetical protein